MPIGMPPPTSQPSPSLQPSTLQNLTPNLDNLEEFSERKWLRRLSVNKDDKLEVVNFITAWFRSWGDNYTKRLQDATKSYIKLVTQEALGGKDLTSANFKKLSANPINANPIIDVAAKIIDVAVRAKILDPIDEFVRPPITDNLLTLIGLDALKLSQPASTSPPIAAGRAEHISSPLAQAAAAPTTGTAVSAAAAQDSPIVSKFQRSEKRLEKVEEVRKFLKQFGGDFTIQKRQVGDKVNYYVRFHFDNADQRRDAVEFLRNHGKYCITQLASEKSKKEREDELENQLNDFHSWRYPKDEAFSLCFSSNETFHLLGFKSSKYQDEFDQLMKQMSDAQEGPAPSAFGTAASAAAAPASPAVASATKVAAAVPAEAVTAAGTAASAAAAKDIPKWMELASQRPPNDLDEATTMLLSIQKKFGADGYTIIPVKVGEGETRYQVYLLYEDGNKRSLKQNEMQLVAFWTVEHSKDTPISFDRFAAPEFIEDGIRHRRICTVLSSAESSYLLGYRQEADSQAAYNKMMEGIYNKYISPKLEKTSGAAASAAAPEGAAAAGHIEKLKQSKSANYVFQVNEEVVVVNKDGSSYSTRVTRIPKYVGIGTTLIEVKNQDGYLEEVNSGNVFPREPKAA